jgi:hypothetical protein
MNDTLLLDVGNVETVSAWAEYPGATTSPVEVYAVVEASSTALAVYRAM